ncbi:MAG: hypothetical protein J6J39_06290 [Clostridia bacterium]|nr:hypothetical protein [Clostridia bacterium]
MEKITISKEIEKLYILKNLHLFPMVVIGSAQAGVSPSEYIDRFFEVLEAEPLKIISKIKITK